MQAIFWPFDIEIEWIKIIHFWDHRKSSLLASIDDLIILKSTL